MLIAAADDLLSRGGPGLVTLRAVGAAVQVSRTAPYRHFRNKDDLLSAVAVESLERMTTAMREAADATATPDGTTALYRACLAYVHIAWERPNHYRLEFGGDHAFTPSPALVAAASDFHAFFEALVVEAQRTHTLLAGDVREVGPLLWVILHGLAMSNHLAVQSDQLAAGGGCASRADDPSEQMPRLVALALRRLAPHAP